MSGAVTSHAPDVLWRNLLRVDLEMRMAIMHANMLVESRHGRKDVKLHLLTLLEVRAPRAPRTVRHLPRRQKRWREHNCFWIFLQQQTSLTNGGLLFRAFLALLTAIRRTPPAKRLVAGSLARRLAGEQQLSTPRPEDNDRQLAGSTPVKMIPRRRLIREFVAISVTFFENGRKKTLKPLSSDGEKRIVNQTSAQDLLSTSTRQRNLVAYPMR